MFVFCPSALFNNTHCDARDIFLALISGHLGSAVVFTTVYDIKMYKAMLKFIARCRGGVISQRTAAPDYATSLTPAQREACTNSRVAATGVPPI